MSLRCIRAIYIIFNKRQTIPNLKQRLCVRYVSIIVEIFRRVEVRPIPPPLLKYALPHPEKNEHSFSGRSGAARRRHSRISRQSRPTLCVSRAPPRGAELPSSLSRSALSLSDRERPRRVAGRDRRPAPPSAIDTGESRGGRAPTGRRRRTDTATQLTHGRTHSYNAYTRTHTHRGLVHWDQLQEAERWLERTHTGTEASLMLFSVYAMLNV